MLGAGDNSVETELKRALERNISVNTIFFVSSQIFLFLLQRNESLELFPLLFHH